MAREQFVDDLVAILEQNGSVSRSEATALKTAFEESSQAQFDEFLLDEGLIEEEPLLAALSEYYQVPSFNVCAYFFKREQLHKFPKDFLLRNGVIPIDRDQNMFIMVAAQPDDPELLAKIGEHVSYDIRFRVGIRSDICDAVKEFYDLADTEVPQDADTRREHMLKQEADRVENDEPIPTDD